MPKLTDTCHYIRSKNAGPFWITIDLFFKDREAFDRYAGALSPDRFAEIYDVEAGAVKFFTVPDLNVLKISYPRTTPQGGVTERDMHGGQQFVRLLDVLV